MRVEVRPAPTFVFSVPPRPAHRRAIRRRIDGASAANGMLRKRGRLDTRRRRVHKRLRCAVRHKKHANENINGMQMSMTKIMTKTHRVRPQDGPQKYTCYRNINKWR